MQLHTQNNVNVYEQVYKKAPIFHQMKRFLYVHIQKKVYLLKKSEDTLLFYIFFFRDFLKNLIPTYQ
jgi:hypothetical protein